MIGGVAAAALLLVCATVAILGLRTEGVTATVAGVEWERSVAIQALRPVEREAWWDEIPSDAQSGSCSPKYRYTSDQPVANSREVCGTPYTVDTGTGIGEVVQECVYEVSEDWCSYTATDWVTVDTATLRGQDLHPEWPSHSLASDQRAAEERESYSIHFRADGTTYTYTPGSDSEFRQYAPGSTWVLNDKTMQAWVSSQIKIGRSTRLTAIRCVMGLSIYLFWPLAMSKKRVPSQDGHPFRIEWLPEQDSVTLVETSCFFLRNLPSDS